MFQPPSQTHELIAVLAIGLAGILAVVAIHFLIEALSAAAAAAAAAALCLKKYSERKRRLAVIDVPESPFPTRRPVTPSSSQSRQSSAVRRGGKRRFVAHRRLRTKIYDPPQQGDCGFACLLHAANKPKTKSSIKELRLKVAEALKQKVLDDEKVAGRPVKDLMVDLELTLAAYLEHLKGDLWASAAEVIIGAEVLGINIAVAEDKKLWTVGDHRPRYVIALWGRHFVMQRLRKSPLASAQVHPEEVLSRGGMKASQKPKPPPPPGLQASQSSTGSMLFPTPLQTAPSMPKDYVPMSVTDMSKTPMPPLLGKAAESTLTIASRPVQPWTWSTNEAVQPEQTPRQTTSTSSAAAASSSTSLMPSAPTG